MPILDVLGVKTSEIENKVIILDVLLHKYKKYIFSCGTFNKHSVSLLLRIDAIPKYCKRIL